MRKKKTPYQEAVDEAEAFLSKGLEYYKKLQKGFGAVDRAFLDAETYIDDATGRVHWTGNGVENLISDADIDAVAFDALQHVICDIIAAGRPIPEPLASFTLEALQGKRKRPPKRGPYEGANVYRDRMIFLAVYLVIEKGFNSVHEPNKNGVSACGAVAEALKRMGETPHAYRTVKEIWEKEKRPKPPLDEGTLKAISDIQSEDIDKQEKTKRITHLLRR